MAVQTGSTMGDKHAAHEYAQPHDVWNYLVRGETRAQRLNRCYAELLQEIRVAQTGVQVLLAFLLWVAFTPGFATLSRVPRTLYLTALVLDALALVLLIAPACAGRRTPPTEDTGTHLGFANRCALAGMGLLCASMTIVICMIFDVMLGSGYATVLGSAAGCWFAVCWYLLPLAVRRRSTPLPTSSPVACASTPMARVVPSVAEVEARRVPDARPPVTCRWVQRDGRLSARWHVVPRHTGNGDGNDGAGQR